MDSPIRQLVGQHLAGRPNIDTFHAASARGIEAVTGCGSGLDPFAGERILAAAAWEEHPKGFEHRAALAITDLRTCVSGYSSTQGGMNGKRYHVPHASLHSTESKDSLMGSWVKLHGAGCQAELAFPGATGPLAAFFEALTRVHPHHRRPPQAPMPGPSADDPAGLNAAKAGLWTEDAPTVAMLDRIAAHLPAGMPVEVASDLVHRVVLDHRMRASAPGMRDGRWLSPIPAQDLGQTLCRLLGNPTRQWTPQPGVHQLDFTMSPDAGRALGGALTAMGVASYVGLGVGFAPGAVLARAMMRKAPVKEIQILFADTGPHAGYRLLAYGSPLEERDSKLAHQIHLAIGAASHRVLTGRVDHGWNAPYDALMQQTPSTAPPSHPPVQPRA